MATICAMQHRNRLYNLRKQQGLSQEALAKAAKTTKGQIGKLEMGKRRLTADWIMRLSRALGCRPADLLEQSSDDCRMLPAPDRFMENQPENELDGSAEITQVNPLEYFEGEPEEMASVDPVYQHVQQIRRNQADFEDRFDATAERFGERVDSLTKAVLELLDELKKDRPKRTTQPGKK